MNVEEMRKTLKDVRLVGGVSQEQARSLHVIAEVLVSILEIMEKTQENKNGQ